MPVSAVKNRNSIDFHAYWDNDPSDDLSCEIKDELTKKKSWKFSYKHGGLELSVATLEDDEYSDLFDYLKSIMEGS